MIVGWALKMRKERMIKETDPIHQHITKNLKVRMRICKMTLISLIELYIKIV